MEPEFRGASRLIFRKECRTAFRIPVHFTVIPVILPLNNRTYAVTLDERDKS